MKDLEHEKQYVEKIQSKTDKTNKVYVFNEVGLEITRRCPLSCDHCLKGEQQQKGMSKEVMEDFFKNVMGIRTLSLASGETTFAVNKIKMLNECLRKYNPTIEKVFIYTNGIKVIDEYINQLKLLQQYVVQSGPHPEKNNYDMSHGYLKNTYNSGNAPLVLAISNDRYHKKARKEYFAKQALESKNPETYEKFVEGIEKLAQNFPVGFLDDNIVFNIGKGKQLEGVKKYNMPSKKFGVWQTSRYGVQIVHTFPYMGVYYDGSLGNLQLSYNEQDNYGIKVDSNKTMYERLLLVPNAEEVKGNNKSFRRWVIKQELKSEFDKLNPLNYTTKAETQETASM